MINPITGGFIDWVCGKLVDKGLKYLLGNDEFSREIENVVKEWAKSLRSENYVHPSVFFGVINKTGDEVKGRHLTAIQEKLLRHKWPGNKEWQKALVERWEYIRKTVKGPQPFFLMEETRAKVELKRLAESIYAVCKHYAPAFQMAVIDKVDEISDTVGRIDKQLRDHQGEEKKYKSERVNSLHQFRAPTADFTGRKDELKKLLSKAQTGANISGLQGMGGVGKTELAIVVANRLLDRYADAQLFVELKGTSDKPLSPTDALLRVIQSIRPDAKPPDDVAERRKMYLSLLYGKRAIILADDAASAEQVRPLLPPASCLLLVTSRYFFTVPGLVPVRLDCLRPEDAVELLLNICPRIDMYAADVARACGYLPLALRAAASLLAVRENVRPEDYVRYLRDEQKRLETIGEEGVEIGVEASLMLTYRQLKAETACVLRMLSIFPSTFDVRAEEAVCQDERHRHLGELLRYSIVEYNQATERYRLHDLVRVFAARRLGEPANAAECLPAQGRHAAHYAKALKLNGQHRPLALFEGGVALFGLEDDNFWAAYEWAKKWANLDTTAARLKSLCDKATTYSIDVGKDVGPGSLKYTQQELNIARNKGDRRGESDALGTLGIIYAEDREFLRAIECYEQQLPILQEIGDREQEGNALFQLGNMRARMDELPQAIRYYEQALPIFREIGGRREEATILDILGHAYWQLSEFPKAIGCYEQSLPILLELGDRNTAGLTSRYLGIAYVGQKEFHRAIEYYKQSLAISREIGDRGEEGAALCGIGLAYTSLDDAQRAMEYLDQYLKITRELGDRSGEGNALLIRSPTLYYNLGRREDAIAEAEAALRIFEDIGDTDPQKVLRRALAEWRSAPPS